MLRILRLSPCFLLVLVCAEVLSLPHAARAMQPPQNSQAASAPPATTSIAPAPVAQPIPTDPLALYQALTALRPDGTRVYTVKDLNLRRDVINFT
ncbi:MAG: hypothetical protein WCA15_19760, partial [Candidatus Acidiferrales bacterium]